MHATRLYAGCMASRVHTDRLRWWTFVAVGVVMQRSGASSMSERPEIDWLFDVASDGGGPGAWALALAAIATAIVTVRAAGRPALFGALLLVVSSVYFAFAGVHVYWPRGIFTMVAVAAPSVGPPRDNHRCERHLLGFEPLALDGLAKAQATPRSCPRQPCSYDLGFNPTISQPIAAESRPRTRLL